jgi:betaine reductase
VISQEIERVGIPTAVITTLVPTALMVGASRIVPGLSIMHPVGDPGLSPSKEREVRRAIVLAAVEAVRDRVLDQKVFDWQR